MLRIPVVSLLAVTLAGLGLVPTAAAQEASPQGTSILESARAKAATQEAQPIPRARLRSGVRTSLGLMLAGAGVAWLSTPVANSGPMFGGPMPQGSPGATMPVATITPATGTPNTGAPSGPTTAAVALQPARGGGLQLGGPQLGGAEPWAELGSEECGARNDWRRGAVRDALV